MARMYVFDDKDVAALFAEMFNLAFTGMKNFTGDELSKVWHVADPQAQNLNPVRADLSPVLHCQQLPSPLGS